MPRLVSLGLLSAALAAFAVDGRPVAAADPVPPGHAANMAASRELFVAKVRPVLIAHCLECHGGAKTKAGLNLATREGLLAGGDRGAAVVPGKGSESPLVRFVARTDEPHMPPKAPAPAGTAELLAKWIDLGAAYDRPLLDKAKAAGNKPMVVTDKDRDHWAYRPLRPPAPPAVKDAGWPRADRQVRSREAGGRRRRPGPGRRSPDARPPGDVRPHRPAAAPEEVEAFLADPAPDAYEKVVDRLLASPAFGERWARHWLDPARFAESHGFEHDYPRPFAYHYRDFVIRAINADMPYDQFVRWQIAGDELAPADPEALAATGFLGAGVYPTQITTPGGRAGPVRRHGRHARHHRARDARPHRRLRPLPRPQVRPDPDPRLLPDALRVHHHRPQPRSTGTSAHRRAGRDAGVRARLGPLVKAREAHERTALPAGSRRG